MSFIMNNTQECLHYANAFYNVAYNIDLKDIKMHIPLLLMLLLLVNCILNTLWQRKMVSMKKGMIFTNCF